MLCVNCNDRMANSRNLDQTAHLERLSGLTSFLFEPIYQSPLLGYNTILIQNKKDFLLFRTLDKSRTLVKSV